MTGKVREGLGETCWEKWSGTGGEIGKKMGNNDKEKSRSREVLWDTDKERRNKHEHSDAKADFVSNKFY